MFKEILEAKKRLRYIAKPTPLIHSRTFSRLTKNNVFLKLENLQKTGSFKVRGAYNKLSQLSKKERKGVIASSAGNHAQGVAYSASKLKIPSTIVMPKTAPLAKVEATKSYGTNIILHGECYDDAYKKAKEIQKRKKLTFIHPYDDKHVIAGQGTIALEILEEFQDVDIVLVPVGGGGLIAGIATAIKNINKRIKVIGVEAENANAMQLSLRKNKLTNIKDMQTIADGIAVKHPGKLPFRLIKKYVDRIVTVSDDEISSTILMLLERNKLLVEPAGIVPLAALLYNKIRVSKKNIVCVISGGNIDIKLVDKIIKRGLVSQGRLAELNIKLLDKQSEIDRLFLTVKNSNANIIEFSHTNQTPEIDYATVSLALETKNLQHIKRVIKSLRKEGFEIENY